MIYCTYTMWITPFCVLVLTFGCFVRQNSSELISDENEAWDFLIAKDRSLSNLCLHGEFSHLDLTIHNFTWQNFTNPLLKRAFQLTAPIEAAVNDFNESHSNESTRSSKIWGEMVNIFFQGKVCIYHDEDMRNTDGNCPMINRTQIIEKFYKVGNLEERKYYWIALRDTEGKMRDIYAERMQLFKEFGNLPNYNEEWVHRYEQPLESIAEDVDRVWQEILPLYQQLHAYIRRRLINVYGTNATTSDGPIPSHLLGLSHWWNILDIVLPYPEKDVNNAEIMEKKNITVLSIAKLSEDFFHSLGLSLIEENIWNNSYFSPRRECFSNVYYSCDFKVEAIKICAPVNEYYMTETLGIFLAVYIANEAREPVWPQILTRLPTPSFQVAIRNVIELSSWTSDYLSQAGLIEALSTNCGEITDEDINQLMKVALKIISIMANDYKTEKWIWDAFNFVTSNNDYNKKWWEYSLKYEGTCPPVRRTENDFDPASSVPVILNMPDIRKFIGSVYSFQFYKAACKEAGHTDLLHRCNLYGIKTFGDKIKRLISLGKSIQWQEGISLMTNAISTSMDTKPLLEYFRPLYEWLIKVNERETIGWQSDDPMVCP